MDRRVVCLLAGDFGSKGMTLVASAYLARSLGEAGFGMLSFGQAIVSYAHILADCGLAAFGAREIARNLDTAVWYARSILGLRLLLGAVVFVGISGIGSLCIKDRQLLWVLVASAIWLIPAMLNLEWVIQGLRRVEWVGLGRFLTGFALLGAVFLWSRLSTSVVYAASVRAVAEVAGVGCNVAIAVYLGRSLRTGVTGVTWAGALRLSAPLMFAAMFASVYAGNLDMILIGIYHRPEHAGWYSAAYRLYLMLAVLPKLLLVFYYPKFACGFMKGIDRLRGDLEELLTVSMVYGLPAIAATFVLAADVVAVLYGPHYVPAVPLLKTLSLGSVSLLLGAGLPSMLMATRHTGQALVCYGSAMVVNVALNLTTIPIWGERAASLTTVVSESMILVSGMIFVKRTLGIRYLRAEGLMARCVPAVSVMGVAASVRWALTSLGLGQPVLILIVAGAVSAGSWGVATAWLANRQRILLAVND